jgi:hypothetical protein
MTLLSTLHNSVPYPHDAIELFWVIFSADKWHWFRSFLFLGPQRCFATLCTPEETGGTLAALEVLDGPHAPREVCPGGYTGGLSTAKSQEPRLPRPRSTATIAYSQNSCLVTHLASS